MNTWAEAPAGKARQVRPGQVLTAVTGWAKASWPQVIRAGSAAADAIAAVFVAAGWILGFGVFCLKGMVYGFCSGAGIPQLADLAARRRAARKHDEPG